MNKRQAKKYLKKINDTVEQHKSGSISNTHRVKRRGAHNKYYIPVKRGALLKLQPQIKGFDAYKKRKTYFSGPFDTFGELKGYNRAAQSAGNRIEYVHPGFFDKYIELGVSNLLDLIFDNYANYHSSSFYDANESFVDEAQYEFLIEVLDEQLDKEEEEVEE